jgi:hypothetical protein
LKFVFNIQTIFFLSSQNIQLPSNSEQQIAVPIVPQRFQPLLPNNPSTTSISSLFQDRLNQLNNLTKEIQPQIIPSALENKVLNTNSIPNEQQQQDMNNDQHQQQIGQNVPAPPLANNAQRQQQPDHVESAQAAPRLVEDSKLIINRFVVYSLNN